MCENFQNMAQCSEQYSEIKQQQLQQKEIANFTLRVSDDDFAFNQRYNHSLRRMTCDADRTKKKIRTYDIPR